MADQKKAKFFEAITNIIFSGDTTSDDAFCILITFRRFITPKELFEVLVKEYTRLSQKQSESAGKKLQSACDFLSLWISKFYHSDFRRKPMKIFLIETLQKSLFRNSNELKLLLIRENKNILFKNSKRQYSLRLEESDNNNLNLSSNNYHLGIQTSNSNYNPLDDQSTTSSRSSSVSSEVIPFLDLLEMSAQQIANCLTDIEYELFCNIQPIDLVDKIGWAGEVEKKSKNPIDDFVSRFNEVSLWVTNEVLRRCHDRSRQTEIIEKFIDVAKKCETLSNFNGVLEIVSGLNHFTVHRLLEQRLQNNDRAMKDFHELETLMSPINNFKNYNERISQRKGVPVVPHFGIFLRDLTFLGENKPYLDNDSLDMEAIRMIGRKVISTSTYQSMAYRFSPRHSPSLVAYLKNLQIEKDEDTLYQWSLKSEPSAGNRGSITALSAPGSTNGSKHNSASEDFDSIGSADDHDSVGSSTSASSTPTGDGSVLEADGIANESGTKRRSKLIKKGSKLRGRTGNPLTPSPTILEY